MQVLEGPIDLDVLDRATEGVSAPRTGVFRMGETGRLVEQKGYGPMINALATAASELPEPRPLTIIDAKGNWRADWHGWIKALRKSSRPEGQGHPD